MTVSITVVLVKPSSPETDVKTNPVVETQYITIDLYKRS